MLGFAGLAMMSVQFILTARFRRATAPFGIDIIYYFHRYVAGVAFVLVLAHPTIILVGNPELAFYLNPLEAPWFMTLGVLSTLALTLVLVTSYWRGALGIPYDSWRVVHTGLAVAAVLLALLHVQGVGFYVAEPLKRGLWTLITLSWIGVIGWIRIVRPWRLLRRPYEVAEVRQKRGDAWTLALAPGGHGGFVFQPGQFVWLTLRHSPFAMREHPFSVSSSPGLAPGRIELTIKELGDFTRTIGSTAMGERAYVDGPYGAFSIDRHPARGYVFVAGGIGIAPIMSMLRALADRGMRVRMCCSMRTAGGSA